MAKSPTFRQSLKYNNYSEAQVSKAAHLIFQHLTQGLEAKEIAALVDNCEGVEDIRFGIMQLDTEALEASGVYIPQLETGSIDGSRYIMEGKVIAPSLYSVPAEAISMADNYLTVAAEKRQKASS